MPRASVEEMDATTAPDYETPNQTIAAKLRFYWPGTDLSERWAFDNPFKNSERTGELQAVAYYPLTVKQGQFFHVPTALTIINDQQEEMTANVTGVFNSIMSQYREQGIILVEKTRHKSRLNDPNVASTDEEAKEMGDALWMEFLRAKALEWMGIVQNTRNMGGVPLPASGLYKYALKKLSIADPANTVEVIENERKVGKQAREDIAAIAGQDAKMAEMQRQMDDMRKMLADALAAKNTKVA
jgi:hypothetical protein